jgi:hypothetical protein
MAIARKPQPKNQVQAATPASADEKTVLELIEKGGSVATTEGKGTKRKIVQVFFRAPADIIERADEAAKSRPIPSTRQNWLLEAILEKLEREPKG